MKIWIFSDLHLEFEGWEPPVIPDADVCIAAGDIAVGVIRSLQWLEANVAPHMPAVFVAGNHEFYSHMLEDSIADAREAAAEMENVHFLEDDFVVLGGTRFVGSTLWTDFALDAKTPADIAWSGMAAEGTMADYKAIRGLRKKPFRRLSAPATAVIHGNSRRFIESVLAHPFGGPSVVVTHHAPHPGSIGEQYRDSGLNAAFASDLDDTFERYRPDLWVHGHVHGCFDYTVHGTRVLCNPRGYPRENPSFYPKLVVEV